VVARAAVATAVVAQLDEAAVIVCFKTATLMSAVAAPVFRTPRTTVSTLLVVSMSVTNKTSLPILM
jgi:hypothetical protein